MKLISSFLLGVLCVSTGAAQTYHIVPIGSLGGTGVLDAMGGVNASGQAAGAGTTTSGAIHALFFDQANGGLRDLGTLGGSTSRGNGINDAGTVVGKSQDVHGNEHAFVYTVAGGMQDIHSSVSLGGLQSSAIAINSNGAIVGWSNDSSGHQHAFFYSVSQGLTDIQAVLPFGGSNSAAYGVNSSNQVVGWADLPSGDIHAFAYNVSTGATADLGTLGGSNSIAFSINSSGLIVGESDVTTSSFHAFQTPFGTPLSGASNLGTFGGSNSGANSVNDAGEVVGGAELSSGLPDPFIYDPVNGLRDLSNLIPANSGWVLDEAQGISRLGHIVGFGYLNDVQELFLLVPNAQVVPSSELLVTSSGLAYSRVSKTFNGTVTVTNIGTTPINGPLELVLTSLTTGVTLANATGTFEGNSYIAITLAGALGAGQSATLPVQFKNPSNAAINFTPVVYSGSLN